MANTISETLEYKTQIHTAWDGAEQRLALRQYPRRSVSYDYYGLTASQSQYLRALCYAKQNTRIEIPLWHACCRLTETAYANFSHIKIATVDLWPFRGCSGVEFWHNDQQGGERYFLNALYGDGNLKLTEILESDYPIKTTAVYPVAYGYLQPEDKYTFYTASHTLMQLNVELLDDYALTSLPAALSEKNYEPWGAKTPYQTALPASYQGIEIFPPAPSWTGDLAANFSRRANKLDNESGLVKYDLKSIGSSENKEIEYVLSTKADINNFQRFFCKCKGRWKSFYAPTWLSDLVLTENAPKGQTYLLVQWPLYWQYYAKMSRRKVAVVFLKNGKTKILPLAGYSTDSSGEHGKVYLDNPLTETLQKADVAMISYLCRYRFDTDILTTDYDTTGIATVATTFTEVNA